VLHTKTYCFDLDPPPVEKMVPERLRLKTKFQFISTMQTSTVERVFGSEKKKREKEKTNTYLNSRKTTPQHRARLIIDCFFSHTLEAKFHQIDFTQTWCAQQIEDKLNGVFDTARPCMERVLDMQLVERVVVVSCRASGI